MPTAIDFLLLYVAGLVDIKKERALNALVTDRNKRGHKSFDLLMPNRHFIFHSFVQQRPYIAYRIKLQLNYC